MHIIDTHNHSLPSMDDGAKDINMALAMLKVAAASGTKEIVLTPHHLNGAYQNFTQQIEEQAQKLRFAAEKNKIHIIIHVGSEVHLVPETLEHLVEQKALTYGGHGKAALIELPKHSVPNGTERILSELIYNGITPILAHPERNSILRRDSAQLKEWVEFGCKTQVTGQSCSGDFGKEIQTSTMRMISDGLVHVIASDAHRPIGRSPNLKPAIEIIHKHYGSKICTMLFSDNPSRLITGRELLNLVASKKKKVTKRASLTKLKTYVKPLFAKK